MAEEEGHGCVESLSGGHSQHDEDIAPQCYHIDGQEEVKGRKRSVAAPLSPLRSPRWSASHCYYCTASYSGSGSKRRQEGNVNQDPIMTTCCASLIHLFSTASSRHRPSCLLFIEKKLRPSEFKLVIQGHWSGVMFWTPVCLTPKLLYLPSYGACPKPFHDGNVSIREQPRARPINRRTTPGGLFRKGERSTHDLLGRWSALNYCTFLKQLLISGCFLFLRK